MSLRMVFSGVKMSFLGGFQGWPQPMVFMDEEKVTDLITSILPVKIAV
jgi:hypothetical protein